jgi:hypothetical protein
VGYVFPMLTVRSFITAGNATFTVKSLATGVHFTFKVQKPDEKTPAFVKVLTGSDNENDFAVLGTIFASGDYRHNSKKSPLTEEAPSAKAFAWLWRNIDNLPQGKVEFLPACACCRCGRKLTHPTSVELAIGPECRKHMGV